MYTDHKPLLDALLSEADPGNARQARQFAYVSKYTTDIEHLSGTSNIVADALSKSKSTQFFGKVLTLTELLWQKINLLTRNYSRLLKATTHLTSNVDANSKLLCDDSQPGALRSIVPTGFHRTIFNNIHNLSRRGTKATFRAISKRYVWPNMNRDISF